MKVYKIESLGHSSLFVRFEGEGHVQVTLTVEELVLELDPVESDGVESALHDIHHHQDSHSNAPEGEPEQEGFNDCPGEAGTSPSFGETLLEEHFTQLGMSEGESPQSEVRGSVRDSSEDELDSLDHLMDKEASERVVVVFFHTSLFIKDLLVGREVILIYHGNLSSVNELVSFVSFRLIASRCNVIEFFVVVFDGLAAESPGAGLNTEHEGHTDSNTDDENQRKALLSGEEVNIAEVRLTTECHQVVNHDRNDGGVGVELVEPVITSVVGVESVAPLVDDKEVHPAEESIQNDESSQHFENEYNSLSFVNCVETLNHDTYGHVDYSDNDGGTHLDGVEESQRVGVKVPCGVNTEGVHAVITSVGITVDNSGYCIVTSHNVVILIFFKLNFLPFKFLSFT
jgi:hypothetical protein